jgi:chromosome segregation ATPase
MSSLRFGMNMVLILGTALSLQACGDSQSDKLRMEAEQRQKYTANLESQLNQARESIARQQDEKRRLVSELDSQREKIRELEAKAAEMQRQRLKEPPDAGKIGLMGAKAVAEFKAEQLSKRLDKLSADLEGKEKELARIDRLAKEKDAEVAKLRESIEKLQAAEQSRVHELQSRLDNILKELEQRSADANRFKQDLQEKSELLAALKNAISDAGKLKSVAEAEAASLQTELANTRKQLEATKAQLTQDRRDLQDCAAWADNAAKEMERQAASLEQYRAEAGRIRQESEQLKAAYTDLSNKLKAAEAAAASQERESTIDKILEAPKVGSSDVGPSSSLY